MLKVYLVIEGTNRPYAVVGNFLFEDERYFVIDDSGLRKKIPWSRILYIEDTSAIEGQLQLSPPAQDTDAPPADIKVDTETTDINVFFTGHKERTFKIPNIQKSILVPDSWSPDLIKTIFANPQIKAFMGDFVVASIDAKGENVYIKTAALNEAQTKQQGFKPVPTIQPSESKNIADLTKGAEAIGQIFKAVSSIEKKFNKPASQPEQNTFSMSASPFDTPISLQEQIFEDD